LACTENQAPIPSWGLAHEKEQSMKKTGFAGGLTNYGDQDFALYLRRSFARSMGLSDRLMAAPIIGIAATESGFNNCHRAMPELVEAVSRGVLAAGGLPRVFPTISLGEVFLNPTSMMFRNLMAMDTEEMIRAQPMDAVVLIGGCDKTVPAQLMGRAVRECPGGATGHRSHVHRPPQGRAAGSLHRLPPLLGEISRRRNRD
jgi:dihydroxyacid dehydratase/phosphogluconate dehydratase